MYFNYYVFIMFIPMNLLSSLMIFSSSNWFSMWLLMEINLISFIFMLFYDKGLSVSMLMMYMLIQNFNSYLYLFFSMFIYLTNLIIYYLMIFMMNLCLLTKLGMSPLFNWYPKLMNSISWMNLLFLSLVQKIIPLFLLMNLFKFMNYKLILLNLFNFILSMMIAILYSINQISMRLILCFSSMVHLAWMIYLLMIDNLMMIIYFFIYLFINMVLILLLNYLLLNKMNQLNLFHINKIFNVLIMMIMISLMGLPPMLGFMVKWLFFQNLWMMNFYFLTLMIMFSLIYMFIYIRVVLIFIMNAKSNIKFLKLIDLNYLNLILFFIAMMNFFMLLFYEFI